MSDTKCAHCGAGMHRLTRWCQKCGKSAGNPVIPITYPTMPVSSTSKSSASFPDISFSQTESASVAFTPAPAPEPSENANPFNFLPNSIRSAAKPSESTTASSLISQFTQAAAQSNESASPFNFLPQSAQKPSVNANGFHVPEYAAVDHLAGSGPQHNSSGVWYYREKMVATRNAVLPNRCVKCNDVAEPNRIARKLTWHHPLIYALVLFSPLIYIIVALILRKRATMEIPLCTRHKFNRKMIMAGGIVSIFLSFPLMFASGDLRSGMGILISTLMLLVGIVVCNVAARIVTPTKIDDQYIWVKGVCQEFRDQLPSV